MTGVESTANHKAVQCFIFNHLHSLEMADL
jgi:hypothetical protein